MEGHEIITYFLTQGPFAALFVWLLISTMKRNSEREDRLHATLDEFASKYDIISGKLDDIKERLPPH